MTLENNAFKLLVASFLLFFALSFSRFAFAQEGVSNGQGFQNLPQEEPGSGPIIENSDGTVASSDMAIFNYWWLLPVIAIPTLMYLVYLSMPKRHNRMDLSTGYAGAKGGRARKDEDIEDDDLF